jgi:signal transduction histidine kinase
MKQKITGLSQRYMMSLRKHLEAGGRPSLQPALRLGHQAVALGLETLQLARIHEQALIILKLSNGRNGALKRAEHFFTEAISAIAATHGAARQSKVDLARLNKALSRRTVELATANRQLRRSVVQCKVMQTSFGDNGRHRSRSLKESLQLQKRLRQLTHRVLAAGEDERQKISHELQDEIAQTLLGINVRLLALKETARSNTRGLKNEIASTQKLVVKSAKSVRRFARELNLGQLTHTGRSSTKT